MANAHSSTSAAVPPPPQRISVVAQFTAGDLTWGQLRAIVRFAANDDREVVQFDQEDDRADGMVGGIHLEVATP